MGYIKEPSGVDLNIGPMPLTAEDRKAISAIIALYKNTGEMPKIVQKKKSRRNKSIIASNTNSAGTKPTTEK